MRDDDHEVQVPDHVNGAGLSEIASTGKVIELSAEPN
jgi:hypothetical protein